MIQTKKGVFFGYYVVVGGFVISALILGCYRAYGVFFNPLAAEFGWNSALTSGAYSTAYLVMGVLAIVSGKMTDKVGPRIVLIVCGVLLGAGYYLMSMINSVWQLYLVFGLLVGAGLSGVDAPLMATVARWFSKRRGAFTGITKAGAGVGMLVIPILSVELITGYGWRKAYVVTAVISFVGIVCMAFLLRKDPAEVGQFPDGISKAEAALKPVANLPSLSMRQIAGTLQFWIFAASWFMLSFCMQTVMLHIAPHAIDVGMSPALAATILGTTGAASIVGRVGLGTVSDKFGNRNTFVMAIGFLSVALVWIQFSSAPWMFFVFAILYGIAHGAIFTLLSPIMAELFGLGSLGVSMGVVLFVSTLGGFTGPIVSGRMYDITKSYHAGFLIALAFSLAAIILAFLIKPRKKVA